MPGIWTPQAGECRWEQAEKGADLLCFVGGACREGVGGVARTARAFHEVACEGGYRAGGASGASALVCADGQRGGKERESENNMKNKRLDGTAGRRRAYNTSHQQNPGTPVHPAKPPWPGIECLCACPDQRGRCGKAVVARRRPAGARLRYAGPRCEAPYWREVGRPQLPPTRRTSPRGPRPAGSSRQLSAKEMVRKHDDGGSEGEVVGGCCVVKGETQYFW